MQIKHCRGTTAQLDRNAHYDGEICIDTVKGILRVYDGVHANGVTIPNDTLADLPDASHVKIAHDAMPSESYLDLNLPTSGGTVTAPADGYLCFSGTLGIGGYISVKINDIYGYSTGKSAYDWAQSFTVPVSKNAVITVTYSFQSSTTDQVLRFIYANGSVSEI